MQPVTASHRTQKESEQKLQSNGGKPATKVWSKSTQINLLNFCEDFPFRNENYRDRLIRQIWIIHSDAFTDATFRVE